MRRAHWITCLLVVLFTSVVGVVQGQAGGGRAWLRVDDQLMDEAVAGGAARSATFAALLRRLEASDVILYVLRAPAHGLRPHGRTQFVVRSGGFRFVRIVIRADSLTNEVVALLGHELRHVAELADASWVNDASDYHALYREIGYASWSERCPCFDTAEAVAAGRAVLLELRAGAARAAALAAEE